MAGLNHNAQRTHGFENLTVEGSIPAELRGTLYRVGPGLVERFARSVHPFLADGLITAVKIADQPVGASDLVRSEKFLEEDRAGHALYDYNAPFHRRLYNGVTRTVKNTGNTHVLSWQNRVFALMEQGQPVEFDAKDLSTIGSTDLDILNGSFSAHPHRVEARKTTYNFGINGRHVEVYALPDSGQIRLLCRFRPPWASLIHDFIVTDRHLLFFIDPGKLVVWRALLGMRDFTKYFQWDEEESSTIVVIPIDNPDQVTRIEVDPFRVWHFANAYEVGDEILVDAFRHRNIDVLNSPTELTNDIPQPELYRFRIKPGSKQFADEKLGSVPSEFPSVNPQVVGAEHHHIWMQTYADAEGTEGFARFDIGTGRYSRYFAPEGHLTSEPMFVPDGTDEATGWVLQLTKDAERNQSYLAIHDAQTVGAEPQARLWFNQAIPATFHGIFVPNQ